MENKSKIGLNGNIIFKGNIFDTVYLKKQVQYIIELLSCHTFHKDEVVAIAIKRTPLLINTIYAMLNMGITFMPLDTSQPIERIKYMLDNAGVKKIISDDGMIEYEQCINVLVNQEINNIKDRNGQVREHKETLPSDVVYLLYTSGSTGQPKAVEVLRKGLINFVYSIPRIIKFPHKGRIACLTNVTFDIFFLETILALNAGLTVVLADEEERSNPKKIVKLIKDECVDIIQMTPSMLKLIQLVDSNFSCLKKVKIILVGGELFPQTLLMQLRSVTNAEIFNMYGPTETTIWSTISNLTNKNEVDIGTPIDNTGVFLLNENLEFIKKNNEVGEICISGDGLAKGYKNNKAQTENQFINHPSDNNLRIYKTGDLGTYNNDGLLMCLGRIDQQIKLNGHRIELEEIDENIKEIVGLRASVTCLYQSDNVDKLVTFYLSDQKIIDSIFFDYLQKKLPEYMIPQMYILVPHFLYTSSNKIDRKKMIYEYIESHENNQYKNECESIENDIGLIVCQTLRKVLDNESLDVSLDTKFQEINVNSINYVNLIVELEDIFDIEFDDEYMGSGAFEDINDIVDLINVKGGKIYE